MEKDNPTLIPSLRSFWETNARIRVLHGGRASGKSWDAAGFSIFLASNYKVKFLCLRQFQNRIEESVYSLLKSQIYRFGLEKEFLILNNKIIHKRTGSEFIFYGLWRHVNEIKSLEGVDVCWLEEAHNITEEQWKILEPTIRKEGSQFWIIFNPNLATDFVYKRFVVKPPPNTIVRQQNYDANPFLPSTIREVIDNLKKEDYEEYLHIYKGQPRQDDDDVIIKRSWVMSAIDAHIKLGVTPTGKKRVGFDVADSGKDTCVNTYSHGILLKHCEEWKAKEDELAESSSRTFNYATKHGAKEIVYDAIGVGASAGSHFKNINLNKGQKNKINYFKFNAGGKVVNPDKEYMPQVLNKDFFANLKAQAWWQLADRFKETHKAINGKDYDESSIISISGDIDNLEKLIDELTTPKKDHDKAGKVMVESKKDLAKRGVDSPNLADAVVMNYAPIDVKAAFDISKLTAW